MRERWSGHKGGDPGIRRGGHNNTKKVTDERTEKEYFIGKTGLLKDLFFYQMNYKGYKFLKWLLLNKRSLKMCIFFKNGLAKCVFLNKWSPKV